MGIYSGGVKHNILDGPNDEATDPGQGGYAEPGEVQFDSQLGRGNLSPFKYDILIFTVVKHPARQSSKEPDVSEICCVTLETKGTRWSKPYKSAL